MGMLFVTFVSDRQCLYNLCTFVFCKGRDDDFKACRRRAALANKKSMIKMPVIQIPNNDHPATGGVRLVTETAKSFIRSAVPAMSGLEVAVKFVLDTRSGVISMFDNMLFFRPSIQAMICENLTT